MLRLIKEVEPPRPSTRLSSNASLPSIAAQRSIDPKQLSRSLSGGLDWIARKALEKECSRRSETANGLARDIERLLNQEPVEARPPSTAYRVKKFFKRHKAQTTAATLVILTLVGGIIGTSWGLKKARIAEGNECFPRIKAEEPLQKMNQEREAKEIKIVKKKGAEKQTAIKVAESGQLQVEKVDLKKEFEVAKIEFDNRLRDLDAQLMELQFLEVNRRSLTMSNKTASSEWTKNMLGELVAEKRKLKESRESTTIDWKMKTAVCYSKAKERVLDLDSQ